MSACQVPDIAFPEGTCTPDRPVVKTRADQVPFQARWDLTADHVPWSTI
jgi:hypothetical protein